MHLKKWMCMLVAVTIANTAFAGMTLPKNLANPALPTKTIKMLSAPASVNGKYPERSNLEYIINNTFLPYEMIPLLQPVTEEMEPIVDTATALRAGLLAYEAEVTAGQGLSETNKIIDEILQRFPGIFNKIQNSSDEIVDELFPVLEQLTVQVVANQHKVNRNDVNQDVASQLLFAFVYQKAELDGTLLGRVSSIIQREFQEALESMQ